MWKMNCNRHGKELKISDQVLHARKLRPLMPRPTASTGGSTMEAPQCCCSSNNTTVTAWNYHLPGSSIYQSKRVFNAEPLVSPRWNPTPEQIQTLEDMYRRGLRTPTAEQIQQIAAKLRQFGKIEGKNVFYWFQNHKARERQKWRRHLSSVAENNLLDIQIIPNKHSELLLSKNHVEFEQAKNWATLSNCSTMSQDSVSKHREVIAESRTNGWADLDEREFHNTTKSKRVKKATIQPNLSPCQPHHSFFNSKAKCINFFTDEDEDGDIKMESDYNEENQILQLFPPGKNSQVSIGTLEKENEMLSSTPRQFFEFLPLKT